MEISRRDIIIILSAIPMAFVVALLVVLLAPTHSKTTVHTSAQVVDPASTSTNLVTTTTATPKPVPAKPVNHVTPSSTTSTSEVPPPLTPEQEAKIPGPVVEGDADADEHMPTDYDLPYDSVDIQDPQS